MKKRSSCIFIAALSIAAGIGPTGQASGEDVGVGAVPYVSRVKVEVAEGRVTLRWMDFEGLREGTNVVYRYTKPITESTFPEAVLLSRVALGEQTYVDDPPDDGGYFYAILVEDKQGKIHPIFIPFRNCTASVASIRSPTVAPKTSAEPPAVVEGAEEPVSAAAPAAVSSEVPVVSPAAAAEAPTKAAPETPAKAAPEAAAAPPEPGPIVSALAAVVEEYRIRLTWKDPVNVTEGSGVVYRSLQVIDSVPPRTAEALDRVPAGMQAYEDIPPDEQPYFYAVLWEQQGKRTNPGVYPGRNRTAAAVAVLARASEEKMASRITGIQAKLSTDGESITVSFRSSNPRRELLLFWSTSPIATAEDLTRSATPIPMEPKTFKHQVYTIPGADSWFAVLDAGLFKVGKGDLITGENTTTSPVAVALRLAEGQMVRRRTLPLPELRLNMAIGSGAETGLPPALQTPVPSPIAPATAKALASILSTVAEPVIAEMRPEVLPADRSPSTSGELLTLIPIAAGPLMQGKMAEAEQKIRDFLKLRRSPNAEAHARYYLGQAYYFQGRFREAFLEFLSAQDLLYVTVQPWMDACYRQLARMATGSS